MLDNSPGTQLYLYRILQMLAAEDPDGKKADDISYEGARRLSSRLGLVSTEMMAKLFADLGLGNLTVDIDDDRLVVNLLPASIPAGAPNVSGPACDLEHGLIDEALQLITGAPVKTIETRCWTRGDGSCRFEAVRDQSVAASGYRPAPANGRVSLDPAISFSNGNEENPGLRAWYADSVIRELARARRHDRSLSLLYIDMDDLGAINSALGRPAGDQVLGAVGASLCRSCRAEDYIWHQGEDEFIVALAETEISGARVVAERLNNEIVSSAEYVDFDATVSASIGFSTFPLLADNLRDLIQSARSALYLAKAQGKDRIKAAGDSSGARMHAASIDEYEAVDDIVVWPPFHPGKKKASRATDIHPESKPAPERKEPASSGSPDIPEAAAPAIEEDIGMETVAPKPVTEETAAAETEAADIGFTTLIASSSPLLLAGMKHTLAGAEGISMIKDVTEAGVLPEIIADLRPDLVFTDLDMATAKKYAALRRIREDNLPCKVVVFAAEVSREVLRAAADFEADGVIMHDCPTTEVLATLRSIYKGQSIMPDEVQAAIDELENNRRLLNELSNREIEVLRLVAEGKSNAQISKELFITVNTVRFHLANIYQKLSVSNRTEAANYYLRQGLDQDGQTKLL